MKYALEISRGPPSLPGNEKCPKLFSSLRASYECYGTGWVDNVAFRSFEEDSQLKLIFQTFNNCN